MSEWRDAAEALGPWYNTYHLGVPGWGWLLVVAYAVPAFVMSVYSITTECGNGNGAPWMPPVLRTDGCLMLLYPVALLGPPLLWPVWTALIILFMLGYLLIKILRGLHRASARCRPQTCCGIPIRRANKTDVELGDTERQKGHHIDAPPPAAADEGLEPPPPVASVPGTKASTSSD